MKSNIHWVLVIFLATVFLVLGPCNGKATQVETQVTCEDNYKDQQATAARIDDLKSKFKATTDERERFILGLEGTFMMDIAKQLEAWRLKFCSDA